MPINTQELKGAVYSKFGTASALSEKMGWNKNKIGNTLKGKYTPDIEECVQLASALELTQKRFCDIFLPSLSPNGDNGAA